MNYKKVFCQETLCPYGKQEGQRCVLGEVCVDDLKGCKPIRERHKCPRAKTGSLQYVIIELQIA